MDPDAALEQARSAALAITAKADRQDDDVTEEADTLAEHFQALDEWLSRGGFLPAAWRP